MTTYAATIMNKMAEWGLNGFLVKVDIAKAFATVPHHAIISACDSFGVPLAWCQVVEQEVVDNKIVLSYLGQELGTVALYRGILEGSPFSPLLFAIFSNYLMQQLLSHPQFVEVQLVLPAAANHPHLRLPPVAYFDDWLLPCCFNGGVQRVLDIFGALVSTYDMALAADQGKIAYIGRGSAGSSVFYGGEQIMQAPHFVLLGVRIDSSGSAYAALEFRFICASAAWAQFQKLCNLRHLNIGNYCKAVSAVFSNSLVYGMGGWPFDATLAIKLQSYVSRTGLSAVPLRISRSPTIAIAHLRRLEEFKELKRNETMRNPLLQVASQRTALFEPPPYLKAVLQFRTLTWARSLSLSSRPARTRGGRILDLQEQLAVEKEEFAMSKHFGRSAWTIRYGAGGLWS